MEDIFVVRQQGGLTDDELRAALEQSLQGRNLRRVLIIPPDFTRFHSQAGKITNLYYHLLKARGVLVDILPALGTHAPVTKTFSPGRKSKKPTSASRRRRWAGRRRIDN